jgi:hypothetical protein
MFSRRRAAGVAAWTEPGLPNWTVPSHNECTAGEPTTGLPESRPAGAASFFFYWCWRCFFAEYGNVGVELFLAVTTRRLRATHQGVTWNWAGALIVIYITWRVFFCKYLIGSWLLVAIQIKGSFKNNWIAFNSGDFIKFDFNNILLTASDLRFAKACLDILRFYKIWFFNNVL